MAATIYNVCVVVVVHRHDFIRLYGNPQHPRIYLYKKDILTHYDALAPGPALPPGPGMESRLNPIPTRVVVESDFSDADGDGEAQGQGHIHVAPRRTSARQRGTARIECQSSSKFSDDDDAPMTKSKRKPSSSKPSAAPATQLWVVGMQISTDAAAPKHVMFQMLRLNGHTPIQRNSRDGYIWVKCKFCDASCGASCNQRDAWYLTTLTACACSAGKCCMVVYSGV